MFLSFLFLIIFSYFKWLYIYVKSIHVNECYDDA